MTAPRAEKVFRTLLIVIVFVALAGLVLLLSQARSTELALFEILAFGVSLTALTLATLGSINNLHQVQTMRTITRELHEAIAELKDINQDNETIKQTISKDYELGRDIAEALAEVGIIDDDDKRQAVAGTIERKIRAKQ